MKPAKLVKLRVPFEDWKVWKAQANGRGLTLSDWIRRKCSNKPLKGRTAAAIRREIERREQEEERENEAVTIPSLRLPRS